MDENIGEIKPLSLRTIIRKDYMEYLMALNLFAITSKDIVGEEEDVIRKLEITYFDLLVTNSNDSLREELRKSLEFFLNTSITYDSESEEFTVDGKGVINRDNFDIVREVIRWQNCINKFDGNSDEDNSEDENVRRIKEKLKKSKEVVSKLKSEEEEGERNDIFDLISSISSRSNSLNKLNIFDLSIFQLYEEFKRLDMIDQYELAIKSMLAGAKEVKLKHWSSKLD